MSIDQYILSILNIDKENINHNIKCSNVQAQSKNILNQPATDRLIYCSNVEHRLYSTLHQLKLRNFPETNSHTSDDTYITVSSATKSFFTAVEEVTYPKVHNNLESEISFDSGIDEGKRDLITRLLQSKGDEFFSDEESGLTNCQANFDKTEDLLHDIEIERRFWNDNVSEEIMYKERLFRYFQTIDYHETPDSCQSYDLAQKKSPVNRKSRHYYMNLSDEHFSYFEKKNSSSSTPVSED